MVNDDYSNNNNNDDDDDDDYDGRFMDLDAVLDDGGERLKNSEHTPMKMFTPITPICTKSVKHLGSIGLLLPIGHNVKFQLYKSFKL